MFSALSAGILLISNISAVKIWDFFGIPVDGGILLFPLSYILGDLVVEIYGEKISKIITISSFAVNVLAVLTFLLVQILPAYPAWLNQEAFEMILGFTPRIVCGSLLAYVSSQLLNIYVFCKIKDVTAKKYTENKFFRRAIGSSLIAHFVDSVLFETIAFVGVLPWKDFLIQAGFAYLAGIVLEIVLFPIIDFLAKKLKIKIVES